MKTNDSGLAVYTFFPLVLGLLVGLVIGIAAVDISCGPKLDKLERLQTRLIEMGVATWRFRPSDGQPEFHLYSIHIVPREDGPPHPASGLNFAYGSASDSAE